MTENNNSKELTDAPGRLSSFLVHTPSTKFSFLLLISTSLALFLFLCEYFPYTFSLDVNLFILSTSSFLLPAILFSYLVSFSADKWNGRYPLRYGFQANSVAFFLVSLSIFVNSFFGYDTLGLLFGFGIISSIWYLTLRTHGNTPEWISFLFAFMASFSIIFSLSFFVLYSSSLTDALQYPYFLFYGGVSALSFTFASFLYLRLVDYPYKQAIGASGLRHMAAYIEFFSTGNGERLMKALSEISESVSIRSSWVCIRNSEKPLAFFAIPGIHPGPVGDFGGSNLPVKIESFLPGLSFAFHGANFNDHNPINSKDIDRIGKAMAEASNNADYASKSFSLNHAGTQPNCYSMGVNNALLLFYEPEKSDDVDPNLATIIEDQNLDDNLTKIFVDLHTQEIGKHIGTPLYDGTPESTILEQASLKSWNKTLESSYDSFKVGVNSLDCEDLDAGIGPCGLRTIVFEIGGKTTAILLWDSNGFSKNLRNKLKQELGGVVDNLILSTTDNHFVNKKPGGENPLKYSKNLVLNASTTIKNALSNLDYAEASSGKITTHDVDILGRGKQDSITNAVNTTIQIARYSWLPIYGSAFMFYLQFLP